MWGKIAMLWLWLREKRELILVNLELRRELAAADRRNLQTEELLAQEKRTSEIYRDLYRALDDKEIRRREEEGEFDDVMVDNTVDPAGAGDSDRKYYDGLDFHSARGRGEIN